MAEFIGVKSYKAKGKRMTNYIVENIQEIEPIVKKESAIPSDENTDDEALPPPPPLIHDDPAQMKLEL